LHDSKEIPCGGEQDLCSPSPGASSLLELIAELVVDATNAAPDSDAELVPADE
jgi:hypothetical protein